MAQPIIGDLAPKTKVLGVKAKLLSSYLTYYDTVFLVDDTASVNDAEWAKIGHALIDITAEAAKFDGDGISLYFVNDPSVIRGTKNTFDVARVFAGVKPMGPSHIGRRLKGLIEEHNRRSIKAEQTSLKALYDVKPLSIIVLTDGGFTEEPRSILDLIIPALREAKSIKSPHDVQRRVGVQFVQVGNCDGDATEALQKLDDALPASEDAIDTVRLGYSLTVQLLYKILLGSVYDRLDDVTNEDLRRLEIRRRGREDLTWYGDRQIDIRKSVPSRDDLRRNGSTDEYRQVDMRRSVPVLNGSTDEYRQIDMRRSVPDLKPNGSTDEYRQIDMRRSVPSREDVRRNGTYTTDDSRSLSYNEDHHREINRRNGSYVADDSRELTYSEEHHTTRTVPRRPVVTEDERTVTITEEHHVNEVRRPPPPPVTRDERTVTVTTETRRAPPRQETHDDTRTVTYTEEHRDITTGRRTPAVITDDSRTVTYNEDHHREANRRNGTYVADDSRGLTYSEDHHRETYGRRGPYIADDSRELTYNEDHHRERTRNGTYITDDSRGLTYNEDHYRERPTRGGGTLITDDERALTYNEDHRREYNGKNGTYTTDDSRGLTYSEDHHRERYGRGGSYVADDSRELTYNEDHHREYTPGKTITHGYSNTRDSQWSNQNGHETGRTKEVSTVVVSGRYPFQLAKNEFALSIPSGCRAVVTAVTNAACSQRVIIFTNPVRPGFPEIFEGSGEGKPMRNSTGSVKGVTIPGGVWLVIQTDYAVRGDGFTKWVPARNKCVYRKGNTYQIGSDDGNPGGRRDYDYNDSVVTVKFLPANTVA